MDAVLKRFSRPRLPGPFAVVQCEGQKAKITGFHVPCKRKVNSLRKVPEMFQESLHLGLAERMLVAFAVYVICTNGP
jgi:hypothetical protein